MIPKIQNILYATDLSENSDYAFKYAINSAVQHNAKIHMLHVIEPLSSRGKAELRNYIEEKELERLQQKSIEEMFQKVNERLNNFAQQELKDDQEKMKKVAGIHVVRGDPAAEILKKTEELGCDIIIMGTHGKGAIGRAFLGSVSERVLRRIHKPVYIIPLPN